LKASLGWGTLVTNEQLEEQASDLGGATMPDGQKKPEYGF
jgi:hypothetical protein